MSRPAPTSQRFGFDSHKAMVGKRFDSARGRLEHMDGTRSVIVNKRVRETIFSQSRQDETLAPDSVTGDDFLFSLVEKLFPTKQFD